MDFLFTTTILPDFAWQKLAADHIVNRWRPEFGEAVGIAAAFNTLDRYPDDASLDFDYGLNYFNTMRQDSVIRFAGCL